MLKNGTLIEMTKGYRGTKGLIVERTLSPYEFYTLKLENGMHLVAGPSAFNVLGDQENIKATHP